MPISRQTSVARSFHCRKNRTGSGALRSKRLMELVRSQPLLPGRNGFGHVAEEIRINAPKGRTFCDVFFILPEYQIHGKSLFRSGTHPVYFLPDMAIPLWAEAWYAANASKQESLENFPPAFYNKSKFHQGGPIPGAALPCKSPDAVFYPNLGEVSAMLTKRQTNILQKIAESELGVEREDLMKRWMVSSRTIRNEIAAINTFLADYHISVSVYQGRYCVPAYHRKELLSILSDQSAGLKNIPQNVRERHIYLLIELFAVAEPLQLYELSAEVFVSRSTLLQDTKAISARFPRSARAELSISNGAIQLEGPEWDKREVIYQLLYENSGQELEYVVNVLESFGFFAKEQHLRLFDFLVQSLERRGIMLSDGSLNRLVIMLLITADRIKNGFEVADVPDSPKAGFALDVQALSQYFGVTFSPPELVWLSTLISRCRVLSVNGESAVTGELARQITEEFLSETVRNFDLPPDLFTPYRQSLEAHIRAMLGRVFLNTFDDFLDLREMVKDQYPLAYEIATGIIPILRRDLSLTVPESELYYITMHIAMVFEDNRSKINVLLICGSGMITARLMERRIREVFATRVNVVGVYPRYMLKTVLGENPNIDLIVSAAPIKDLPTVPVIEISPLLNDEDIHRIERYTSRMFYRGGGGVLRVEEGTRFQESLFHIFPTSMGQEEIIHTLAGKMAAQGIIDDVTAFERLVFEREELHSTVFSRLWIPHPMHPIGNRSAVAVGILREEGRLVFLVSTVRGEAARIAPLYDKLLELMDNEKLVEQLCQSTDFTQFMERFEAI